jgi:iron(III) transport system permease protein
MIIALIGMPLGGFYGVLLGYLVARKQFAGRAAMEIVSMINYALPGTIVGHRVSRSPSTIRRSR